MKGLLLVGAALAAGGYAFFGGINDGGIDRVAARPPEVTYAAFARFADDIAAKPAIEGVCVDRMCDHQTTAKFLVSKDPGKSLTLSFRIGDKEQASVTARFKPSDTASSTRIHILATGTAETSQAEAMKKVGQMVDKMIAYIDKDVPIPTEVTSTTTITTN
ncbi:MAG: hypothetical protein JWL96_3423 [Sphingomonas bacterium]|uniref:hypothetical protein n=1 Tax=Sphingomonas bacterium TaxID=1895847 RepID=UPI002619E029|nr:hypothetical protein [Sphingomonas bacterium]MDB5711353.1 hypothetical protein [Sphingomonas bacterium]